MAHERITRGHDETGGSAAPRAEVCAVAIMAKESRPGLCKTRLVPPLSAEQAAELNTCFLQDIGANIVSAAAAVPIEGAAAYHPAGSEAFFREVLPADFLLLPPREPGIGRSLFHAARDLLAAGFGAVCLVNADSPTLPTRFLVEAVQALQRPGERVVFGPSADGGYYLIGLRRFRARLFEDIDWSTERVLAQSLERAAELGLEAVLLPAWYDVDDAAGLRQLERELASAGGEGYHAPRTRAWFGAAPARPRARRSA